MMLRKTGTAIRLVRAFSSAQLPPTFFEDELLNRADGFYRFQREWKDTRNLIDAKTVSNTNSIQNVLELPPAQRKRVNVLQEAILSLTANEKEFFMIMLSRRAKHELAQKSKITIESGPNYEDFLNQISSYEDSVHQQLDPRNEYKLGLLNSLLVHPDALAELAGKVQTEQAASNAQAAKVVEAPKAEEAPQVGMC